MNWTWSIRSSDGGMNGLEFARCTTGGGHSRVLIHAAPAKAEIEVRSGDGELVASGDLEREGDYSPMTLVDLGDSGGDGDAAPRRTEIWPAGEHLGLPVLLAGGEVGILREWQHADDHSWWRWQVEFSNHSDQPDDWTPPGS